MIWIYFQIWFNKSILSILFWYSQIQWLTVYSLTAKKALSRVYIFRVGSIPPLFLSCGPFWIPMANVQEGVSMLHQSNSDSPNSNPEYQCWPVQWVSNALQVSVHLLCNFDISDAKAWTGVEELKMNWLKNTGWGWRIGERVEIERWWSTRVKVSDASRQSRLKTGD